MKTKHKRCWYCGRRLQGNKGVIRTVDGHEREMHRSCSSFEKEQTASDNNAFGMEY